MNIALAGNQIGLQRFIIIGFIVGAIDIDLPPLFAQLEHHLQAGSSGSGQIGVGIKVRSRIDKIENGVSCFQPIGIQRNIDIVGNPGSGLQFEHIGKFRLYVRCQINVLHPRCPERAAEQCLEVETAYFSGQCQSVNQRRVESSVVIEAEACRNIGNP